MYIICIVKILIQRSLFGDRYSVTSFNKLNSNHLVKENQLTGMVCSSKEGCNIIMTDGAISVHVEMFEHVHGGLMGVQVIVLPLVDKLVTHDATTPWKKVRRYTEC